MHVSVIFIGQDVLKSMQVVSLEKLTNGASGLTRPGAKKGSKNTGLSTHIPQCPRNMLAGFFTCLQTPGTARAELAAESKNRVPDRQKNTAEKTFRQERFLHAAYNKHRKLSICASTGSSAASGRHKSRMAVR